MAISAPLNGAGLLGETYTHNTGGTADAYVLTAIPSVGQTLRFMATAGAGGQGISSISQTGVRWRVDTTASALLSCAVWTGYCWSASASATVNVTTLIAATAQRVTITVYTGLGAWPGVHAVNSASDNTGLSTTASPGSISPTASYDYLVVACARNLSGTLGGAPSGGFTALNSASNGYLFAYKILTAHDGSAVTTSWTIPASNWEASICAIRVTPTISATIDALVAILDPADQSPSGKCKIVRDCRVPALTALENGVNIVAGQAHRWNDYRQQSSTLDAIGGAGVDASGYSLVGTQGTGTEYLHGNGGQWMASTAAISTLDLSGVPGFTIIDIVRVTANGGVGGIAASPTAATAPYCMNTVEAGTYKMASSMTTSLDTAVASGATWRVIITQRFNLRNAVSGMNAISSGDQMHHVAMGGRAAVPQVWDNGLVGNAGTAYAAGNNFDVMGRQAGNVATLDHAFHAIVNGELTSAQRLAVEAYATAMPYGVTLDTSHHMLLPLGASFNQGLNQSAVQQADPPLKYCVVNATGGLGTLTSRGWEANPFTLANYGISARTIAMTAEGIATTSLQNVNPAHPGYNVFVVWDIFYNSMKTLTAAACELEVIGLLTTIRAAGGRTLLATIVDGSFMYTAFVNNAAAGGISTQGAEVAGVAGVGGFNNLLRANWRTYPGCVGLVDLAADVNLKPDKWLGVYPNIPASAINTYYDGGQGGHFNNTGYQYIGQLFKNYLDANPGALDPVGQQSRIGFKLGFGL